MGDYPHVVCFRLGTELRDWLLEQAALDHRKLGDMVRQLLEMIRLDDQEERNG
jgi:hypothetical protein